MDYHLDMIVVGLPEDKKGEFLDRFIALVEEFDCHCGGGFMQQKDEDKSDEQTIEG